MPEHIYEDEWGAIIHRPEQGLLEIRWYDTTADLDERTLNQWLTGFAGLVAEHRPRGILVDATSFLMPAEHMNMDWRDANIVPVYNDAGLQRFAFHMPPAMPMIGAEPAAEGPALYPTGYFGTRREAVAWLTS